MNKDNQISTDCALGYKMLGDFWTLRIISTLSKGEKRFCQIERELGNINTATLSKRLAKLHDEEIITRNEISRADVVYDLTERGKLVLPVIKALEDFSLAFNKPKKS